MDIPTLHQNTSLRQTTFPVTQNQIFLANGAVCSLPHCVTKAINHYLAQAETGDQEEHIPQALFSETRQLAATLLGCESSDIALIGPTSIGLSLVANGIDFKPGQNVVYVPDDYPSNAVVWMNIAKRGVALRPIVTDEPGRITLETLKTYVNKDTALVALASAHFVSGYRLDIDAIGRWLHKKGVLFCVDGIQTVGALRTPVTHVDFLIADSHKWLLGPCASGIFYVHPNALERLEPTLLGWNNVICPNFLTPEKIRFYDDVRRYEAGSYNLVGIIGLNASLKLLHEYGSNPIESTVLDHTRHIRKTLLSKGYTLCGSDDENISGLTSCYKKDVDLVDLHKSLTRAGIIMSLRQTRDKRHWIRFAPHFYNTKEEIDEALKQIP